MKIENRIPIQQTNIHILKSSPNKVRLVIWPLDEWSFHALQRHFSKYSDYL